MKATDYKKIIKREKRKIHLSQLSILTFFILMWEILARKEIIDSFVFSMPSEIVETWFNMGEDGLFMHIGVTVSETLIGFGMGALSGCLIAVALWWSKFIGRVCEPYLVILNSLPKIALGPVIIIIAGAGTKAIVFMALAISLVVTVPEMLNGFKRTDEEQIKMAVTFGASKSQVFRKIVLPWNIPTLFNSLKINIGLSLVGVIAGEFLVSKAGLGYLIVYGGQVFRMDIVMASVIILAVVAALMYEAVVGLERVAAIFYKF